MGVLLGAGLSLYLGAPRRHDRALSPVIVDRRAGFARDFALLIAPEDETSNWVLRCRGRRNRAAGSPDTDVHEAGFAKGGAFARVHVGVLARACGGRVFEHRRDDVGYRLLVCVWDAWGMCAPVVLRVCSQGTRRALEQAQSGESGWERARRQQGQGV